MSGQPTRDEGPQPTAPNPDRTSRILGSPDQTVEYVDTAARAASDEAATEPIVEPAGQTPPPQFGRYQVVQLQGRGGMGEVYLGFDPELQRRVAIKVSRFTQPGAAERSAREARQQAQLNHPGIAAVFDVGVQDGQFYIVSDFIQGISLHDWLQRQRPTWQEAVRIAAEVAEALAHAHAQRVIHRDIKPGNVILKDGKTAVVVDFGLALSEEAAGKSLGEIAGTPRFMSPEQAAGKAHRIDGRTDIYAVGVLLYQMLCGRVPFHSTDVRELLRQIREDDPQPPRQLMPAIPVEVERICIKAMARRPAERYTTAADLARELRGQLEILAESSATRPAPTGVMPESKTADTASAVRRARQAERRVVSVLYCRCDLFDSAEFLEQLDSEDQHEILADYQRLCDEAVKQFGGTVVQATGRELLVCLGYPTSYEDAAQRAVLTALTIRDRVVELADRVRRQFRTLLSAWVGIHTGPAVAEETAAAGSTEALSLAGEARNVALHLGVAAQPNTVLITQATHRLVKGFFVCDSLGSHAIKGAAQPLELFRVVRASEVRNRIEVAETAGLTPLVGRDLELGILRDRWEKAIEGMGQFVLLIGDAGLGKSRLIRELRESAAAASASFSSLSAGGAQAPPVIEWRCSPYYQNTGLYPATDFLERWLGFRREDMPAERLDKLVKHLELLDLAGPQIVPLFAGLLSIPLTRGYAPLHVSPQRLKELTQESLREWLRACSAKQPVLFIVEDLHWVDPSTLEFLGRLVEQGGDSNLLSVFTFRPEFETPWKSKAHQTELALNRLTKRQVGEMMEKKTGLGNLPANLVTQIVERTDGVPLFVEEFTQVLLESGSLSRRGDRVELSPSFDLSAIPATLQDLLLARLNRMGSAPEVAQMGAALGREFSHELLQRCLGLEESLLQEELARLVRAEILFQKGRLPRCVYTFKHALIQDAAYQSLLRKTRQQFHKKIGAVLEEAFPETAEAQPELLAHHFTEAGLPDRGTAYWLKAGLRSQARCANLEAISHLSRGLEVLKKLDISPQRDRLELALQAPLGVVLTAVRGWGASDVAPTLERACALCEQYGSVSDRFFALWGLWGFRLLRLELSKCWQTAEDVRKLLADAAERDELLAEAHWIPGCTAFYAGDFPTALAQLEAGTALFNEDRARVHSLRTGQNIGVMFPCHIAMSLWEMGQIDQAQKRIDDMMQFARRLGHPFSLAMALYYRRRIAQYCGRDEQVRQSVEEEFALCHQHGFGFWEAHALLARGSILIQQGKPGDARGLLEPTWQTLEAAGLKCSLDHPCTFLAEAFLHAGWLNDAAQWLDRGFRLPETEGECGLESEFWRLRGELALARSSDEIEAETCFAKAVEIARQQQSLSRELRAVMSLCRLRRTPGRLAELVSRFAEGQDTADLTAARALLDEGETTSTTETQRHREDRR